MTKTTIINTVKAAMLDGYTSVDKLKESTYFVKCLKIEINRVAFEGNYEMTTTEEAEIVEAILS